MPVPVLRFQDVSKLYAARDAAPREALRNVSFVLEAGRVVAMVGRSGSGKSTLLHLAAGIDTPSTGRVFLEERDLGGLGDRERTLLRRDAIGIVFQFFHLLPHLSVEENVLLPEWIAGPRARDPRARDPRARARDLLARVDLADRARDPVGRLSGGEMQRVAICRALFMRPRLLLADEPTGNLDDENGRAVLDLLLSLARESSATLLIATHSSEVAERADAVWRLRSGSLEPA